MLENVIAREKEKALLNEALTSNEPELIAIWGRRRIGKTFLVRNGRVQKGYYFELTGVKDGKLTQQLFNFAQALSKAFYKGVNIEQPKNWGQAFAMLEQAIESTSKKGTVTLFFDEAPWLDSRKSGFLNALEYFWNAYCSNNRRLKVIVCGSSSSWILNKIVKGKGGWHRRVTQRIHLHPFTLSETKQYLSSRHIKLSNPDLIELYMILGGTAQYLRELKRGESVGACIDRLCFQEQGVLTDEFDELFYSLFNATEQHIKIVKALAGYRAGLTAAQIREKTKLGPGRQFTQCIDNLLNADFITAYEPYGKTGVRNLTYRVNDFFVVFFLKWMASSKHKTIKWQSVRDSHAYRSWAGFSFETLVWNHIGNLLGEVGLKNTGAEITKWRHTPRTPNEKGAEIDLLIDTGNAGLLILELKYHQNGYKVTKRDCENLLEKRRILQEVTKTRQSVFIHLLASNGVTRNQYSNECVDYIYDPECLFSA